MLAKLGSIDFGKWTINTSSGFVVTTAVLFIIDALTPGHLTQNLFTDSSAGEIVAYIFAAIVISSVLGLLVDSIFHTFGRWYAKKFWGPLDYALRFRNYLMLEVGLTGLDFEWIFNSNKDKPTESVEKDYLRFTEVAGSTAYTMMLLLGPAIYMLLSWEYQLSLPIALSLAIMVIIGGYILLLTSAASLYKYETRTTAFIMDDIRKLSPKLNIQRIENRCTKKGLSRNKRQLNKLVRSLFILILSGAILSGCCMSQNNDILEANQMTSVMVTIGKPDSGNVSGTDVPTIDILINKGLATPSDQSASKVITIQLPSGIKKLTNITLKSNDPFDFLNGIKQPEWKLSVTLSNLTDLKTGDHVYVNAYLSFDREVAGNIERIPVGEIDEGDWLFPVIVTDGLKDYLLAQIHIKIVAASSVDANDQTGDKLVAGKPSTDKLKADKFTAEKFIADKVTAEKITTGKRSSA
jgi:hypothetical protein